MFNHGPFLSDHLGQYRLQSFLLQVLYPHPSARQRRRTLRE